MPVLNTRGEVAAGIGDGIVSVNGRVIASVHDGTPAGGTAWLDDDTIIYQVLRNGAYIVESLHLPTNKFTTRATQGANLIKAGGGRFVGWLAGSGMFGEITSSVAYPADCGRDGTIAVIPNQDDGIGFSLYAPDGRVTLGPDEATYNLCVVNPTSAIWTPVGGGEFRTLNLRVPKQAASALAPKVATVNGEDWIVYWTETYGLIAHPFDNLSGFIIESTPHAFAHDVVDFGDGLRITYSYNQGEFPEDIIIKNYRLTDSRVNFAETFVPDVTPTERMFTGSTASGGTPTANSSALVKPQSNLLEDDIVYRLALVAKNILQPLKDKYQNIVIRSGLRQPNSGKGQHERGEAVDIQINNQTDVKLVEVANYIKNTLPFDQLILNYSRQGDGKPWIHVSFSPQTLRRQVLTKDFADAFHDGLYLVTLPIGEQAAADTRTQGASDKAILTELTKMQKRQERFTPVATVQDEVPPMPTSTTSSGGGTGGSGGGNPGGGGHGTGGNNSAYGKLVACVQDALGLSTGHDEEENIRIAFETCKRVAWLLRAEGAGLLKGPRGGENVIDWNGYTLRAARICYPDGQIYKILTDVEGGAHDPGWVDDGMVDPGDYIAPMDPGSDITMEWTACRLPNSSGVAPTS